MGAGVFAIVVVWLTALSAYDIRVRRLPNYLTLTGAMMVLTLAIATGRGQSAAFGAAALFTIYFAVYLAAPRAMGGGDVKLAIGVGALTGACGFDAWVLAAVGAPLLTASWAAVVLIRQAGATVPHGPSMCIASAATTGLALLSS